MNANAIGLWLLAGVLGSILTVQAAALTLAWDPPNPATEVTGYKLYYGTADMAGSEWDTMVVKEVDVGQVTEYTVEGLTVGTLYVFAVKAYGKHGRMSDFSNKIHHRIAAPEPPSSALRVVAVDSEETEFENAAGRNVLDGDPTTIWHTKWFGQDPPHPHHIILDLGTVRTVYGIRYLPRQDGELNGTIVGYEVYLSLDPNTWTPTPWTSGSWEPTPDPKIAVQSRGQEGRYLKLVATSAANDRPWTSAAEIQIIGELP
jgi:hypothetical protein